MLNPTLAFHALLIIGFGGALLSSSILAGATLLLAIAGMVLSARKSLYKTGWDKPKELRLLHFSFWFFVLVSFISWPWKALIMRVEKRLARTPGLSCSGHSLLPLAMPASEPEPPSQPSD